MLDEAGLAEVTIFASGNLDEREIARLWSRGAPIDGFGVGSRLAVSADAPFLDAVYKLVAFDGRPVLKLSTGKATLPGAKQVWRRGEAAASPATWSRSPTSRRRAGAEPLLEPVDAGRRARSGARVARVGARAGARAARRARAGAARLDAAALPGRDW